MTAEGTNQGRRPPLQGPWVRPSTEAELTALVERAFDYRGDVTIELRDGTSVEGYVFNREADAPDPRIHVFPQGQPNAAVIRVRDIVAIAFTGEDTASGKSWEEWAAKKASDRRAEAERLAAEAQARGEL